MTQPTDPAATPEPVAAPVSEPQSLDELAVLKQENLKLQRDLSSLKGTIQKESDRFSGLQDAIDAVGKQIALIGRSQATGDSEHLAAELVKIEQEQGALVAGRMFRQEAEAQRTFIMDLLDRTDPDTGEKLVDTQDSAIQQASQLFLQAWQDNQSSSQDRLAQMSQASRAVAQRAAELLWTKAKSDARSAREQLAQAKLEDTDLEPGGGSAGARSDEDLFHAYGRGESLTQEQKVRVGRYRQQLLRKR